MNSIGQGSALSGLKLWALENYGLLVETVPEKYRAEEIIEALRDRIEAARKSLLPRADIARKVRLDALRQVV